MGNTRRHRSKSGTAERSVFRSAMPYVNLLIAAGLSIGLVGVTRQMSDSSSENRSFESRLDRTHSRLDAMQENSKRRLAAISARDESVRQTETANRSELTQILDTMTRKLSTIEHENREQRERTVSDIRRELDQLRSVVRKSEKPDKLTTMDVFRQFADRHESGVLLVYSEFDYHELRGDKREKKRTVSSWGTGFFITTEGHIITNKHVVQPWKFDIDLQTMEALGQIEIESSSLRMVCWRPGTRVVDAEGEPIFKNGYHNRESGDLSVYAVAKDCMSERGGAFGDSGPKVMVHDLNNDDLVILKVDSEGPFPALPLGRSTTLSKLDQVMAIGFPRGQNGLECDRAETSPSIGTVRKIENTIHVTTSIIPGNSGGPLIGPSGRVEGIVTRIYTETLGICIKVEHFMSLLVEQKESDNEARRLTRGILGDAGAGILAVY